MLLPVLQTFALLSMIIGLAISIYYFIKTLGHFEYDTEEEIRKYQEWLEKEGLYRRIMAILNIIIFSVALISFIKIEYF